MFRDPKHRQYTKEELFSWLKTKLKENKNYEVVVGTDSQSHRKSKIVTVVALIDKGHGGTFFYHTRFLNRFPDLRTKIYKETELTLNLATELNEFFYENNIDKGISVHSDIGKHGKTSEMISEIVGWVGACGFDCSIKPDSYVASVIADRISK